ncbi:malate synthase A [Deinococcus sp.]|uniref:malate synthase A n=1 Tax=Deinococcus sp. TaxID=47478 RepID=UPI0025B849B4|nr:malate synthase A [Deinococcus sp.]
MNPPSVSLSPTARALAQHLHTELRERWVLLPGETPASYTLSSARAAPVPDDLRGRRAELIVEASDLDMLRRALEGDADAVAVDFDDTFSPTPQNVQAAYDALPWVTRSPKPLLARTRALYATEPHLNFGGPGPSPAPAPAPAIAALCDLSALLAARPERPVHLYIPKLETPAEAQFWQDALLVAEQFLGLAPNTVKTCLQIETFSGLMNIGAIFQLLAPRTYGLNAGRWDYVFSLTKHLGSTQKGGGRTTPLPPRFQLTMDVDAMRVYAEYLVQVCRAHGAQAIGGTASLAPDPADPQPALAAVLADKQREAAQGFTAAWAGLPELLEPVRRGFDHAKQTSTFDLGADLYQRLTNLPDPSPIAVDDVQDAIGLALAVFGAWYEGRGVVVRKGRIEDTATAELARAQLWQWVQVGAVLNDGQPLTPGRYRAERQRLCADPEPAARLLDALVLSGTCPDYFPRVAQQLAQQPAAHTPGANP